MDRRLPVVFLLILQSLWVAAAPTARAHDHEPPAAELHERDILAQIPTFEVYSWQRLLPRPGTYIGVGSYHYPDAYRFYERGTKTISIRFNKVNPPDKLYIRGWTWIERYPQIDETEGRGVRFDYELRPTLGPTGLAWYADVELPPSDHWYLRVFGRWRNLEGTGVRYASQYVIWQFHVAMPRERIDYEPVDPETPGPAFRAL